MSTKERLDILKEKLDDLFTENERLNKSMEAHIKFNKYLMNRLAEVNIRIDKAIEYIKTFDFDYLDSTYEHNARLVLENILEILKGEDKE